MSHNDIKPPAGLFSRMRGIHDDRLPLQQAAQLAVDVEFATILACLMAL